MVRLPPVMANRLAASADTGSAVCGPVRSKSSSVGVVRFPVVAFPFEIESVSRRVTAAVEAACRELPALFQSKLSYDPRQLLIVLNPLLVRML